MPSFMTLVTLVHIKCAQQRKSEWGSVSGTTSSATICVCERMRLVSSVQVEAVPTLYTESVVDRRRDWLLLRDVVDRRRFRAPLQLFGMLNAQRLW